MTDNRIGLAAADAQAPTSQSTPDAPPDHSLDDAGVIHDHTIKKAILQSAEGSLFTNKPILHEDQNRHKEVVAIMSAGVLDSRIATRPSNRVIGLIVADWCHAPQIDPSDTTIGLGSADAKGRVTR
jgi:hypothetical protein